MKQTSIKGLDKLLEFQLECFNEMSVLFKLPDADAYPSSQYNDIYLYKIGDEFFVPEAVLGEYMNGTGLFQIGTYSGKGYMMQKVISHRFIFRKEYIEPEFELEMPGDNMITLTQEWVLVSCENTITTQTVRRVENLSNLSSSRH